MFPVLLLDTFVPVISSAENTPNFSNLTMNKATKPLSLPIKT